jgi:GNAT superfamily N-acetyltransferase
MSAPDAFGPQVIEETYVAFFRTICGRGIVPAMHDDELFWAISGLPHPIANVVARTRWGEDLPAEATDARIRETLAHFREREMPMLWFVWPSSQPRDLGSRLKAKGLRVEQVRDGAAFERWLDVVLTGFGLATTDSAASEGDVLRRAATLLGYAEPVREYLGWIGEMPVATTTFFLADGAAGIYNVATLPEARGHGIGAVMTVHALRHAQALGARAAILLSSPPGERIYQRLGFVERCRVGSISGCRGTPTLDAWLNGM